MFKNYKELNVWRKSYTLCLHIYKVTRPVPLVIHRSQDKGENDYGYTQENESGRSACLQ